MTKGQRHDPKGAEAPISEQNVAGLSQAIANQREAWRIMEEMHRVSLAYMWQNLPSTTRRKRLSKKTLGTN